MDDLFDVFSEAPPVPVQPVASTTKKRKDGDKAASSGSPKKRQKVAEDNEKDEGEEGKKKEQSETVRDTFGQYSPQEVVTTKSLEVDGCMAQRCYPPQWDFEEERRLNEAEKAAQQQRQTERKPAKTYKFELDPFQREAVACLERNQSVLVSAHTSAGKTVVAEYAIAMALRDTQRVIYTSPIKALSNQKYRELQEEFKDVGLMTGDVTINPSASCLVMTTEILRNMLYRGSEVMREVAWVVFDEIHYMRDRERGVVWEETMILLPHKVRYVFLSATIPNAAEFACWIAKLHSQPCNVVYTDYRPTPLQHYVFPQGGDGLYLVVDEKGKFRDDNFAKALAVMNAESAAQEAAEMSMKVKKNKTSSRKQQGTDIYKIVRVIMDRHYDPVIIFSFSKRECEAHALAMSKLDFTDDAEKKLTREIFVNAMDSLSDDDKQLPQVQNILPLLKRGIGIHHGGLLPILKEVIEILFQEGLIKCLFATETFSMGINMPAKTVVFTSVRKYDGADFRVVSSGEYIQMSGRAGRRGLDDRGIVICMMDEKLEPAVAKDMIKGQADPLNSTFHLGYNMLLNLLRVEEADPEYMILRSFHQFQSNREAPKMQQDLDRLEAEAAAIEVDDEAGAVSYMALRAQLNRLTADMRRTVNHPINAVPFLNPGRLVRVRDGAVDWGWGVLSAVHKRPVSSLGKKAEQLPSVDGSDRIYILDVLLACKPLPHGQQRTRHTRPEPAPAGVKKPDYQIIPVLLHLVDGLSSVRVYVPKALNTTSGRASAGKSLREVKRRFKDGVPLLDPVEDMKIRDAGFIAVVKAIEETEKQLLAHPWHGREGATEALQRLEEKTEVRRKVDELRQQMVSAAQNPELLRTLKSMKRVLRRLGHTTADNVIDTKGRVACEISTCDELVATELIFGGTYNDLTPTQAVALTSCLVFQERAEDKSQPREELAAPFRQLKEAARRVAQVSIDARLPVDAEEYVESFKGTMMEVVYAWCQGARFADICKMTTVFEGSIIRCMRRLEELLRQMSVASKTIGNVELENKFLAGIELLKRDIVFAASLFI